MEWAVSGLPAGGTRYLLMWTRKEPSTTYDMAECKVVENLTGLTETSGAYAYSFAGTNIVFSMTDGVVIESTLTIDTEDCAGTPDLPSSNSVMGSTTIDNKTLGVWAGNPPPLSAANVMNLPVACNTFEMWAVASDIVSLDLDATYSGLVSWGQTTIGTFTPAPPISKTEDTLSWVYTFPATTTGQ